GSSRQQPQGSRRVLDVSRDGRRSDSDLGFGGDHAPEVDVVRTEAPGRPARASDIGSGFPGVPEARRGGMKVLIADKFEKSGINGLQEAGCEVVYEPDLKDDALVEA